MPTNERLRQGLTGACVVLFAIMLLWGGALLWRHYLPARHLFSISRIKIMSDAKHLSTRELAAQAASHLDGGFFSIDIADLRRLLMRNPWVSEVSFRRQWPDMLQITIFEQKPMAIWNKRALINHKGEIFLPPLKDFPAGLPNLSGPDGSLPRVLRQYADLNKRLSIIPLSLNDLRLTDYQNWTFVVAGIQVMLGHEATEQRLERFVTLYSTVISKRDTFPLRVDLRYPNGAAVEW